MPFNFLLVKGIHVGSVTLSLMLFVVRGYGRMTGSRYLRARWLRILPHVVDTILLASAITLALAIGQYPFVDAWLTAKVCGLLVYVLLGEMALHLLRSPVLWKTTFVAALLVFAWIVSVAITHRPSGLFGAWLH